MTNNVLEIEKRIAAYIAQNSIRDSETDVLHTAQLISLLTIGYKKTITLFGNTQFIKNLIKNGAMSKEGIFYVSDEDFEYEYIWFLMTLNVGKGFLKRE